MRLLLTLSIISLAITNAVAGDFLSKSILTIYGKRDYKIYLPKNVLEKENISLVVAVHGCKQDGTSFAGGSRLNKFADQHGFVVLYPEQDSLFNSMNCWNWFNPINQTRSPFGEAGIIVKSIQDALREYKQLDSNKVYLLGMSSGAAISNIVASCFPEMIKAWASSHGISYQATTLPLYAEDVVRHGSRIGPESSAKRAYLCSKSALTHVSKKTLPVMVIAGKNDSLLASSHFSDVINSWLSYQDYLDNGQRDYSFQYFLKTKVVKQEKKYSYTLTDYVSDSSSIKSVLIDSLDHAWSGGDDSFKYNDSKGPDQTQMIIDFFISNGL